MNKLKVNPFIASLLRTIASGLLLSLPIVTFPTLKSLALPSSCSASSCQKPGSETVEPALKQIQSSNSLLSQTRPIDPQVTNGGGQTILNQGPDGRLSLDTGAVDITLANQTGTTVILQLTTGTGSYTTMGVIGNTGVTLHNLEAPVEIDFVQPVGGPVQAIPEITSANSLAVTLREPTSASNVGLAGGTLTVLEDGSLYLDRISLN